MLPGRLRFPGLDPDRRYRIRPILVDARIRLGSTGLVGSHNHRIRALRRTSDSRLGFACGWRDGVILSGAVLASAGVMAANMHPDHAILYRVAALD
jgi:alpha-galactosidase